MALPAAIPFLIKILPSAVSLATANSVSSRPRETGAGLAGRSASGLYGARSSASRVSGVKKNDNVSNDDVSNSDVSKFGLTSLAWALFLI